MDPPTGHAGYRVEALALARWRFIGGPALHTQARVGASINESRQLIRENRDCLSMSHVKTVAMATTLSVLSKPASVIWQHRTPPRAGCRWLWWPLAVYPLAAGRKVDSGRTPDEERCPAFRGSTKDSPLTHYELNQAASSRVRHEYYAPLTHSAQDGTGAGYGPRSGFGYD